MTKITCPNCRQTVDVAEPVGVEATCPVCQTALRVRDATAAAGEGVAPGVPETPGDAAMCAICLSPIAPCDSRTDCPACGAGFHADCWQENGGCAIYGCSQVPVIEQRRALEIPVSYWGQENKPCPACGREILAAAVRCRFCGATFVSARPQDSDEFQRRSEREQRLPGLRRSIILLFALSVLPCLAPIGAIWGAIWYSRNRQDVLALPSLYPALCKIGLAVAFGQIAALALMALFYAALRGR